MSRFVLLVSALVVLAGQALSLNFTLNGPLGTISTSQLLNPPTGPYTATCQPQCDLAQSSVTGCTDNNDQCLCTNEIGGQIVACEQCQLDVLVKLNIKAPDTRVGSNVAISAFSTACNGSTGMVFAPPLALKTSPTFDSNFELILNTPSKVVVVGFGAILAGSALWLFGNLE